MKKYVLVTESEKFNVAPKEVKSCGFPLDLTIKKLKSTKYDDAVEEVISFIDSYYDIEKELGFSDLDDMDEVFLDDNKLIGDLNEDPGLAFDGYLCSRWQYTFNILDEDEMVNYRKNKNKILIGYKQSVNKKIDELNRI